MQDKIRPDARKILSEIKDYVKCKSFRCLAEYLGVDENLIYSWRNRNSIGDPAIILSKCKNIRFAYLTTGEGPMLEEHSQILPEGNLEHTFKKKRTIRQIPVISYIQAGGFIDAFDPFPPGFADEYLTFDDPCGPNTFALIVEGESMLPEFPPGMKIIVDPSLQVENGDLVVVKNGDDQVTFKKLSMDGSQVLLVPLNKQFPTRDMTGKDLKVLGVVIGRYESIRWSRRR